MNNSLCSDICCGKYNDIFKKLYCVDNSGIDIYRNRAFLTADHFSKEYGVNNDYEPKLFSSPGRLELTGNHSDHQGGIVLTGTVNLDILACASENGTDTINIISKGYDNISLSSHDTALYESEKNSASSLVRGMIKAITDKGYSVNGFNMYAVSDVPGGLGMSSSAAFEMLIGVIINTFFCNNELTNEDIAYAGMYAEREYFGKPCGLMDQMACISGGINTFDFRDAVKPKVNSISYNFEKAGMDIIVTDTGTDHADLSDEFNAIPHEMTSVAKVLGGERLCDIREDDFYLNIPYLRKKTGDRAVIRAMHWYDEVKRVKEQGEFLSEGDISLFLNNVNTSGYSSFMYLQNIDNYKDPAYEPVALCLAYAHHILKGKGAVRVQGGGFAGSIIAFVPAEISSDYIKKMDTMLETGACRKVKIRPVGASELVKAL